METVLIALLLATLAALVWCARYKRSDESWLEWFFRITSYEN